MKKAAVAVVGVATLIAAVLTVGAVVRSRQSAGGYAGHYYAIAWLPLGDTRAQALAVRSECGSTQGAASVSDLARSKSRLYAGELVFTVTMRWAPDDERSNPLLACLNGAHLASYAIPM